MKEVSNAIPQKQSHFLQSCSRSSLRTMKTWTPLTPSWSCSWRGSGAWRRWRSAGRPACWSDWNAFPWKNTTQYGEGERGILKLLDFPENLKVFWLWWPLGSSSLGSWWQPSLWGTWRWVSRPSSSWQERWPSPTWKDLWKKAARTSGWKTKTVTRNFEMCACVFYWTFTGTLFWNQRTFFKKKSWGIFLDLLDSIQKMKWRSFLLNLL